MERKQERPTNMQCKQEHSPIPTESEENDRQIVRKMNRNRSDTDRQIDVRTDRQDIQADRQTHRHTDRQTYRHSDEHTATKCQKLTVDAAESSVSWSFSFPVNSVRYLSIFCFILLENAFRYESFCFF